MPVIEVNHVTKEYRLGVLHNFKHTLQALSARLRGERIPKPAPFKALDDVDFKVEEGEVVGIIGHNGAGKSTLLKHLAGITTPTKGSVVVRGKVAPLIEVGAGLIGDLTGRENIYLNAAILGLKRKEIDQKFDDIVAFAELEEFIDTPIKRYSSGMSVRLGFSIATSVEADILIVDEVLAVGDLAFQRKCFDRIEQLIKKEGRTVLVVSHNIRQIERICSRTLLLDHGKLMMDGVSKLICNAFYEQSDRKIISQQVNARKSRLASTGEVELIDLFLVGVEGQRLNEVIYGSELKVVFRIQALQLLKNPIFIIGVHTTDFVYITTASSPDEFRLNTFPAGTYELSMKISDFPLLPGTYSIRISIDVEDPIKNILYGDNLYHFSVVGGDLQRTASECEGFFLLNGNWQLSVMV